MSEVKWIKITTDIFDDEKILLIESLPESDAIIVIWFKLLCLAGKMNNSGVFLMNRIPITISMLASIFRRKETTVKLALDTFEQFGMVEVVDNVITIPNWGKHQTLDALEKKKEYMRDYMRDYRAKQKEKIALPDGNIKGKKQRKTNSEANVSRLEGEGELDKSNNLSNSSNNKILNNKENIYCSEPKVDSEPEVAFLPLNDDSEFGIKQSVFEEWQKLYPAVDVMQELNKMRGWCLANPSKRKTKKGIMRFINNWLSKEQDKGGTPGYKPSPSSQAIGRPSRGQKKMKQIKDENGYNKWVEDTDGS